MYTYRVTEISIIFLFFEKTGGIGSLQIILNKIKVKIEIIQYYILYSYPLGPRSLRFEDFGKILAPIIM